MFELLFYQPVLNLLVFLYDVVPGNDLGVAIIFLTIVIKLLLYPLSRKSIESQKKINEIQPEIEEIKKKYKDNREALGRETLELYRRKKINPFSSCLPLLIQLPFLFAVFKVFNNGFANNSLDLVYPFIQRPEFINTLSLGIFELSAPHNIILALLAGYSQFYQTKMMMARKPKDNKPTSAGQEEDFAAIMNKQMLYMMPVLTAFFAYSFPAGLAFYWFLTTLLTILQQAYVFKKTEETVVEIIPPKELK